MWYKTVIRNCKLAGIKQPIGTHGLRKTYGRRVYYNAKNQSRALDYLTKIFGHASTRTTLVYIRVTDEEIADNLEDMCMFDGIDNIYK